MNWVTIVGILKAILPTKKIAAWILGVIGAIVALLVGVSNSDLKTQYCSSETVNLPALPKAAAPVVALPPGTDVKLSPPVDVKK